MSRWENESIESIYEKIKQKINMYKKNKKS